LAAKEGKMFAENNFTVLKGLVSYLSRIKCVAVDESHTIREYFERYLEDLGFRNVKTFKNGREALDYIENHSVNLVLSDTALKILNGEELFDRIRAEERHKDIIFIFVTADSEASTVKRLIAKKPDGFVLKPFTMATIQASLRKAFKDKVNIVNHCAEVFSEDLDSGNLVKAIDELNVINKVSRFFDTTPVNNYMSGRLSLVQGRMDEAVGFFKEVVKDLPVIASAFRSLAEIYEAKANSIEAEHYYERALRVDPTDMRSLTQLIDMKIRVGDKARAQKIAKDAMDNLTEGSVYKLIAGGEFHYSGREYETAYDFFDKAVKAEGESNVARECLAKTLLMLGRIQEAIKLLKELIAEEKNDIRKKWLYRRLSECHLRAGDSEGASKALHDSDTKKE
jgi:two-component system, chemotaxis family, chemotaxis protein CheY